MHIKMNPKHRTKIQNTKTRTNTKEMTNSKKVNLALKICLY